MDDSQYKAPVPFSVIAEALLDNSKPFPPIYLHRFSDMEPVDLRELRSIWSQINTDRRLALMIDLEDFAEADTLVDFNEIGRIGLDDNDPRIRATAVRLLWEEDDPRLISRFINLMEKDEDPIVRSSAATALGIFVYEGELEELSKTDFYEVVDSLIKVLDSKDEPIVRRRALESLGYLDREEIRNAIRTAYNRNEDEWRASALFAMGRSADSGWSGAVLESLTDPNPSVQLEATRAAGQLELKSARPTLFELLSDRSSLDDEVYAAAIWSLSQIGGDDSRELLEQLLDEAEDDEEIMFIESAIDNLEFTDGFPLFDLLDVEYDDKDIDSIIDLDDEEDQDSKPTGGK